MNFLSIFLFSILWFFALLCLSRIGVRNLAVIPHRCNLVQSLIRKLVIAMDDSVTYEANKKIVHYGSLEEKERGKSGSPAPAGASSHSPTPTPNINVGSGETIAMEDSVSSKTRNELIEEFERRKRGRHVVVSTDDGEVKKNLRQVTTSPPTTPSTPTTPPPTTTTTLSGKPRRGCFRSFVS